MPSKATIHTFKKGMVKDLDRSLLSNEAYLDATNFRITTSTGESTGALENIEGNNLMHTLPNSITPTGYYTIGAVNVRDTIVAFITNDTNSRIITYTVDKETETIGAVTTIYDDDLNGSAGALNFKIAYPIKAVAVYESPTIQKVYWTDGYNSIRYANIASYLTTDGNVYSLGDNTYMSPDKFNFLPEFTPTKPILKTIVGGEVKTGMVAYAYQLYIVHGATTAFSPLSDIIHVVSDSDFSTNTLLYKGDESPVSSGKGFILEIDNTGNLGFNRLRLIRIHYPTLGSIPTITVSNEVEVSPLGGTIQVTDVGNTVNELTIDEFNISSTELFKCGDLAIKDNRLFVANIEETKYTVSDWDARAVRFKASSTATVADSGQGPIVIQPDLSNWVDYTSNHDGINEFNNVSYDADTDYQWMYQADGATLGAEGLNIKIDFETEAFYLDTSNNDTTFYTTKHPSGDDLSYHGYASPWTGGKLSWQRDEVYRLFVVFGNDRGQVDSPKWICDLRMPSLHDVDFSNSSSYTVKPSVIADNTAVPNTVMSNRLYPRVYFKSFPTNATWAQIHRVKRERSDKFVVSQCLAIPTSDQSFNRYAPATLVNYNLGTDGVELVKLVSPEINITKNITQQANDYLQIVSHYDDAGGVTLTQMLSANVETTVYKFENNTRINYTGSQISPISEIISLVPKVTNTEFDVIDGKEYYNYYMSPNAPSKGCSGLLVNYEYGFTLENTRCCIVNYKSNVYGSQYGGHTYEDKLNNVSIPCSDIILSSEVGSWIDIPYGDTFINYFDASISLVDLAIDAVGGEHTGTEIVYVPLESSINCDLRYDTSSAHLTINNEDASIRQEQAGSYLMDKYGTGDYKYEQEFDLYSYNTVYSQQLDVKYAISENLDVNTGTVFDCKVKASAKKFNSELLDSFTIFGVNDYIEVDTSYGPIKALNVINDKLLFWQENAVGVLSVNERSIVQDNNSAAIVLGTGGILDRYDYISTTSGTDSKFSVLKSPTGVYWFYPKDKSIYRIISGIENLSKTRMVQSWFYTNYVFSDTAYPTIRCVYDSKYNQAIFTLLTPALTSGDTIVFDENIDAFSALYDFASRLYIPFNSGYMSINRDATNVDTIYYHNSLLEDKCKFYGTIFPATIKLLFNDEYASVKAFDNIFYNSTSYNSSGYEQHQDSFNSVRCYNNLQNTGTTTLTLGTNLERKEREWWLFVPRNAVDIVYPTNVDILNAANLDTTRLYRDRMRDKYLIVDLTYNNTDGNRLVLSYCGLVYRQSYR